MNRKLFNAQLAQYATPTISGEGSVTASNGVKCYLPYLKIEGNSIDNILADITLPEEYTAVEYIKSTGTQYINTVYKPTSNTRIELDVRFENGLATSSNLYVMGVNTTDGCFSINFGGMSSQITTFYIWVNAASANGGTHKQVDVGNTVNARNILSLSNTSFEYGTYSVDLQKGAWETLSENLILFGGRKTTGEIVAFNRYDMLVYGCKIYDSDILVRDFVPCLRNSDNVAGLYDLVNNVFYSSATDDNFLYKGRIVNAGDNGFECVLKSGNLINYADKQVTVSDVYTSMSATNYVLQPSTTYTLLFDYEFVEPLPNSASFDVGRGNTYYSVDIRQSIAFPNNTKGRFSCTFTTVSTLGVNNKLYFRIRKGSNSDEFTVNYSNFMLIKSDVEKPFEPYFKVTVEIPQRVQLVDETILPLRFAKYTNADYLEVDKKSNSVKYYEYSTAPNPVKSLSEQTENVPPIEWDITNTDVGQQLLSLIQQNGTTIVEAINDNNLTQALTIKYLTHA